jgi:hypothetical protein
MKRISLLLLAVIGCQAADVTYPAPFPSPGVGTVVITSTDAAPTNVTANQVKIGGGSIRAFGAINAAQFIGGGDDGAQLFRGKWQNGIFRMRYINDGVNYMILEATDGAEATYVPMTLGVTSLRVPAATSIIFGTDPVGSEFLRVGGGARTSGNIVIAKSNPVMLLDNNNPAATDATFFSYLSLQRAGVEKGWLGFGNGTNGLMSITNTIGDLDLVANSGSVKVPGGRFSIGGNGRIQVADGMSTATDARWLLRNGTDTHAALRVIANSPTFLTIDAVQANNSTITKDLYVNPNGGNVVLGTGSGPVTNKLTVYGTISAKEIKVTTTGADYVFENDYKLRPLAEVESFIAEHKHLPEMMSAKAMQADGMPVSDVVTKQLAKIEELTLYAIEQKKEAEAARAELNDLKNRMERLEKVLAGR